ncbi:MAG: rubrerythrin family protein [Bacteroidia bacterium]|nr:rubrerythrin family protein [Bacteroidia bacterium]
MDIQMASRYASEELFNTHLYRWLSERVKSQKHRELLLDFANQEALHYDFWRRWTPETVSYSGWRFRWFQLLAWLLGTTFVLQLLERREHETISEYRRILPTLPQEAQAELLSLIEEEEKHEGELLSAVATEEPRLRYIGFIVLGLSDAIIEVTGVHAGFLGVSHNPLAAGIAGLIVGFSASISMASAAYLQAKQNPTVSATRSAMYTGISYVFAVVILALPYFLFSHMGAAFWSSAILAVFLVLGFVYYSSVIAERHFRREALESLGVLGITALLSYGFGELIRYFFPHIYL